MKNNDIPLRTKISNVIYVLKFLYHINKKLYIIRIPLMLIQTATSVSSVFFVKEILNGIMQNKNMYTTLMYAVLLAITNMILALLNQLVSIIDSRELEKTNHKIKLLIGEAFSTMPYYLVEDPQIRDFMSAVSSSNSFLTIIEYTTGLVGAIVNVCTYIAIVLTLHPVLILLIITTVAFQIIIYKCKRNREIKWQSAQLPIVRKLNYFFNILSDPRAGKEIRVNKLKDFFIKKGNTEYENNCIPIIKKNAKESNFLFYSVEIMKLLQKGCVYALLGYKVICGNLQIGDFSAYFSSIELLTDSLSGLVGCFSNLMTCGYFANQFKICMEQIKNKKASSKSKMIIPKNISLEFVDVSFKYPQTDRYVLKNVSFILNAGETLSVVGINGSGKSTIVKLICRFYEPTSGQIKINGIPLNEIDPFSLHKYMSVVFQDYKLFAFSFQENITMSDEQPDQEEVYKCVDFVGLSEKICTLPNKINTYMSKDFDELGIEFSGGECQKTAIARAMYKKSPLLILDEPTASLDPIAEYQLYKMINDITKNKTAIYISHRLSSTKYTDKIIVLEDGEVKEVGNHEELMAQKGLYKEMFDTQAQYYL